MLEIEGLTRRFGDREVVRDFRLSAAAGERVALRGPNGSGKTTILRCILGTLAPSAGSITVGGHGAGSLQARRLVGASLAQERSFYLRLTGRDNLLFFAGLRGLAGREARREVDRIVAELGIEEVAAQRADRSSAGQLQRLALARALLGEPSLLLLDEPTRSLDTEARRSFWAALEARPRTAALVATHLDEDAGHVGSTVALEAPA